MPVRTVLLSLVVTSAVLPAAAVAGETPTRPQVQVLPPPSTSTDPVEPDDLPGPPLEVVAAAIDAVDVPPVPGFDRRAPDGAPTVERATAPSATAGAAASEPPMRKVVDRRSLQLSVDRLKACNTALVAQRYDAAIAECRAATETWAGNHLAWYLWATAYMAKREWSRAQAAVERAVELRPDQAMYQLYHGIALYEAARRQVDEQARRARKNPAKAALDPAEPRLGAAHAALVQAITLAPELWRAHYYLGRVLRDLRDPRHAAEQLTATIQMNPSHGSSYIVLCELYRSWGYLEPALAVATLGTAKLSGADSADLWFQVGLTHDAMQARPKAIEAFGQAIAIRPDDARLRLYRGWLHIVAGNPTAARRDLSDAMRLADPSMDDTQRLAKQLLMQLAGEGLPRAGASGTCPPVKACTVYSVPENGLAGNDWASHL